MSALGYGQTTCGDPKSAGSLNELSNTLDEWYWPSNISQLWPMLKFQVSATDQSFIAGGDSGGPGLAGGVLVGVNSYYSAPTKNGCTGITSYSQASVYHNRSFMESTLTEWCGESPFCPPPSQWVSNGQGGGACETDLPVTVDCSLLPAGVTGSAILTLREPLWSATGFAAGQSHTVDLAACVGDPTTTVTVHFKLSTAGGGSPKDTSWRVELTTLSGASYKDWEHCPTVNPSNPINVFPSCGGISLVNLALPDTYPILHLEAVPEFGTPTPEPTPSEATPEPSPPPTSEPTPQPTPEPTSQPTEGGVTEEPTPLPAQEAPPSPTVYSTEAPSPEPTTTYFDSFLDSFKSLNPF